MALRRVGEKDSLQAERRDKLCRNAVGPKQTGHSSPGSPGSPDAPGTQISTTWRESLFPGFDASVGPSPTKNATLIHPPTHPSTQEVPTFLSRSLPLHSFPYTGRGRPGEAGSARVRTIKSQPASRVATLRKTVMYVRDNFLKDKQSFTQKLAALSGAATHLAVDDSEAM
ncbi:hypothetical protein CDEST_07095 [Colletotrichum destructivum]|uniref:Uncharacterized protein n=1 Tax=Colletotrichum destructivum TaxID=34406 RepID=A0AAX4IG45_9PEZI|nr:hypothetical protein CDEST_07095 [Colletotrichum destructivum]